jgi:hypothetical protein
MVMELEQKADPPLPSSTVREASQTTVELEDESTLSIGVALVESSKLPLGQLVLHEYVNVSPSGSEENVPSSVKVVVVPWHSAT